MISIFFDLLPPPPFFFSRGSEEANIKSTIRNRDHVKSSSRKRIFRDHRDRTLCRGHVARRRNHSREERSYSLALARAREEIREKDIPIQFRKFHQCCTFLYFCTAGNLAQSLYRRCAVQDRDLVSRRDASRETRIPLHVYVHTCIYIRMYSLFPLFPQCMFKLPEWSLRLRDSRQLICRCYSLETPLPSHIYRSAAHFKERAL